jgi:hypothetical protein
MPYSPPEQRCFPPGAGHTVRAEVAGGAVSSDCGTLRRRGMDHQRGLTHRWASALRDKRHPSSLAHPAARLSPHGSIRAPRALPMATIPPRRHAPLFTRSGDRLPLDDEQSWARAPPCSRRAHSADRQDAYGVARAGVEHFLASYAAPPRPFSAPWLIALSRPTASRRIPAITSTMARLAICPCASSQGSRQPWERLPYAPAPCEARRRPQYRGTRAPGHGPTLRLRTALDISSPAERALPCPLRGYPTPC